VICNRGFRPPPTGCLRRHSRAWDLSSLRPTPSTTPAPLPAPPPLNNHYDPRLALRSPISRAWRANPRDLAPLLSSNYKRLIAYHPYFHAVTNAWGVWRGRVSVRTLRIPITPTLDPKQGFAANNARRYSFTCLLASRYFPAPKGTPGSTEARAMRDRSHEEVV
jgi:hypothetical protein